MNSGKGGGGREGGKEAAALCSLYWVGGRKVGERESVGEVNCRRSRGSVRGPVHVVLWGRYWGSCECVCLCRSEKGRSLVNHSREKEEIQHWM